MTKLTVGVIGAGVIGAGVAQNLAQCDCDVVLVDVSKEILTRAGQQIRAAVRAQKVLRPERQGACTDLVFEKICFTTEYASLYAADFVIENVTEELSVKEAVYRQLDKVCPEGTIFAANTSAIPIARIATFTGRPSKVIGIHFMNPVPLKKTVELIPCQLTSQNTLESAQHLLTRMGKTFVLVHDASGFVSNRVLMLAINEAINLVQDRVATAADVDRIFRDCFGHEMGPLETGDLIGLDTVLLSLEVLRDSYQDDKFKPSPLLERMVQDGMHGRKTGQGFYQYS